MNLEQARALTVGTPVRLSCAGSGEVDFSDLPNVLQPANWERDYPAGSLGMVTALDTFKGPQGYAVTVVIVDGPARWVVNVFDEADAARNAAEGLDLYPFELAAPDMEAADLRDILDRHARLTETPGAGVLEIIEAARYVLYRTNRDRDPFEALQDLGARLRDHFGPGGDAREGEEF